jgi:hypothetical protein
MKRSNQNPIKDAWKVNHDDKFLNSNTRILRNIYLWCKWISHKVDQKGKKLKKIGEKRNLTSEILKNFKKWKWVVIKEIVQEKVPEIGLTKYPSEWIIIFKRHGKKSLSCNFPILS